MPPRPLDHLHLWVRRVWTVCVSIGVGGTLGQLLAGTLLDLEGGALWVGVQGPAIVGAFVGVFVAGSIGMADLPRLRPFAIRDTAVGVGAVLAIPAALAVGVVVGMPWAPVAALGVLAAASGGLFLLATARREPRGWRYPLERSPERGGDG